MPRAKDPKSQADKFKDLARALECDEDEGRFDEALKRAAKVPAPAKPKDKPE
jgi:hypothetical protein